MCLLHFSINILQQLPLAVSTAWFAFFYVEIPRETLYKESDKKGILVWSAASSVGSAGIQIAKFLGFHVCASEKHHECLMTLGSGLGKVTLFDYNDPEAECKIMQAAKDDDVTIDKAIPASGDISTCIELLKKLMGNSPSVSGRVASCPRVNILPDWGNVTVEFVEHTAEKKRCLSLFLIDGLRKNWLQVQRLRLLRGDVVL